MSDASVKDFREGDRVVHATVGAGTVVHADEQSITVAYDQWKSQGKYDAVWFRNCAHLLKREVDGK
jgi:hypothetical protein